MYLKKIGIGKETKIEVNFEKIVDDLLMVSVTNTECDNNISSYWRLTKTTGYPPLEIGINCEKQILSSIVFYIDLDNMCEQKDKDVVVQNGSVLVDTSIFKKINDYIDVNQMYSIYMYGNKLICSFGEITDFRCSYKVDRLEIYTDSEQNIIGFAICELMTEEVSLKQISRGQLKNKGHSKQTI